MTGPLIGTKSYVPKLRPGLVPRRRILERLRGAGHARLTLVAAPAGFGKTTALAGWLEEIAGTDGALAWLSLDAGDREPAAFLTYVVSALREAVPDVGAEALQLLASSSFSVELVLTTVVNDLAALPHPVWLVLDDYHLADGPEVGKAMTFLLEHLPAQAHVVVSTRADPGLPLSRWRARGELLEVRAADLRFTSDEVVAYFDGVGLDLPAADLAVLAERTEGWVTALQLAALSLRGRADASDFVARFAGDDRHVLDYLVEEVLGHQTPTAREFLLRSSILERLTGPLCDALTGRADGSGLLTALERANVFLVPLDDRREWFRYHHLFADVLRARLRSERPEEVPLLHLRASRWYESHDLTEEAVRHALVAPDLDRAARLLELALPSIRRNRQDAIALGWLTALPDEVLERSPVLSVFSGYGRLVSGDLAGADTRFAAAERALAGLPAGQVAPWADTEELHTLPATIAVYRASLAQARGDVAGTARHARRALDLAGPDDHLARSGGAGFLGFATWVDGDVSEALDTFAQAVASMRAAGALVDELGSTVVLADMWLSAGRPSRARVLLERALPRAQALGEPVATAEAALHVALSELDVAVDDLENAQRHLDAASALVARGTTTESSYRWFVAAAAGADPLRAAGLLDRAEELHRPGFFPELRPVGALRARTWITRGNLPDAADWARARGLSATDEVGHLREFEHLTFVRLLLAQHRAHPGDGSDDRPLALLDRLHTAAEAGGRGGSLLEIRLLQALALDAQGHRAEASQARVRAQSLAPEPEGYVRLLRELRAAPTGASVLPAGRLSGRELQVLRLLDSGLSGPQIAGELFVSANTLRSHTKHIFTKLDVTSRRAAVLRAHELDLL